jgi:prophage regulatory protein
MRLLRLQEVKQRTGLSSSSIYKQIRDGAFPRGIKITQRATAWSSQDVEEWIASKMRNATVGMEVETYER